jgi:hypothetical protein
MTLTITLQERGQPLIVPLEEWAAYNLETPIQTLADLGVLRLTKTSGGILVTPHHHVGELRVPGAVLAILPKSKSLLAAMEAMALSGRARKAVHTESQLASRNSDDEDPVAEFVSALLACVADGIPWHYGAVSEATSFPRGTLAFNATIRRFAARGVRHRVVVTASRQEQDHALVRVVRAAHECLPFAPGATRDLLADADTLMHGLDDAPPFADLAEATRAAESVVNNEIALGRHIAAQLAQRSLNLISREYGAAGILKPVEGGIALFRDLEDLWERCVLRLVEGCPEVRGNAEAFFHGLAGAGWRLFADGGPKVDPDVVAMKGTTPVAIIDAKYKSLKGGLSVNAADLYQLYAYVRRTSACLGLIVQFSENTPGISIIGTTPEAVPMVSASISPELLLRHRDAALAQLLAGSPSIAERVIAAFNNCVGEAAGGTNSDLPGRVIAQPLQDAPHGRHVE